MNEPVARRDVFPRIAACGDCALAIEFAEHIDEAVNARVIALATALADCPIAGIEEMVPTYRSLMVLYDPEIVSGRVLRQTLATRLAGLAVGRTPLRRFRVPVLYGGAAGLDLAELAAMKNMTPADLIEMHASADYRVYMIGFAPGFVYLGGVPEALHTPRLPQPRQHIAAGSIGLGGQQASINSVPGPSGWRFLGRTPVRVFDPARPQPFLLRAGDRVRFQPISLEEATRLDVAVAAGEIGMTAEGAL
ncbi:MAG: 5-oxoprolinase subunit PxpB [Azospirillaceae bacterium]|nr:5-oxoprolinase subunit PxpB [Azospirillaceae bacterium]